MMLPLSCIVHENDKIDIASSLYGIIEILERVSISDQPDLDHAALKIVEENNSVLHTTHSTQYSQGISGLKSWLWRKQLIFYWNLTSCIGRMKYKTFTKEVSQLLHIRSDDYILLYRQIMRHWKALGVHILHGKIPLLKRLPMLWDSAIRIQNVHPAYLCWNADQQEVLEEVVMRQSSTDWDTMSSLLIRSVCKSVFALSIMSRKSKTSTYVY